MAASPWFSGDLSGVAQNLWAKGHHTMTIHPDANVDECMEEISALEAEVARLRAQNERLQFCLNSRDDFLGSIGQWQAYVIHISTSATKDTTP